MFKWWPMVAAFAAACPLAHAQTEAIPRTPDGRPDFQGIWESRWLTPFERPDGTTAATVAGDEAAAFAAARWADFFKDDGALHPEGDFDFAGLMPAPDGSFRTSLIVEPADGKRQRTQLAKDLSAANKVQKDRFENPEAGSQDERCLAASGRTPLGVTPGSMYRQIVQTPANLVVYTEDQMSSRIIGIGAAARPARLVSPAGDSVARWEGDTLVIETRQISQQLAPPGFPAFDQQRNVTERFTLTSPDMIGYSYVMEDSAMLSAPVRVEYLLKRSDHAMFESACHEGNHSMAGMLLGARVAEAQPAPKAPK